MQEYLYEIAFELCYVFFQDVECYFYRASLFCVIYRYTKTVCYY